MDKRAFLNFYEQRGELLEAARIALAGADLTEVPEGRYVELFDEPGSDDRIVIEAPAWADRLDFLRIGFMTEDPAEIAAFEQQLDEHRGELVREIVYDDVRSVLFYQNKIVIFLGDEVGSTSHTIFLYPDESDGFELALEAQEDLHRRFCADE